MKLAEWAKDWPYIVQQHEKHEKGAMWTPDYHAADFRKRGHRALAWSLDDYMVSSVAGGSIWFVKREK